MLKDIYGNYDWDNPFRLVELLEVLRKYAGVCTALMSTIGELRTYVVHLGLGEIEWNDQIVSRLRGDLEVFEIGKKKFEELKWEHSVHGCSNCIDLVQLLIKNGPEKNAMIQFCSVLDAFAQTFMIDCNKELFFRVKCEQVSFYEKNQFSIEVSEKFRSSIGDMLEAGKCFALTRYTACAFHLMRIAEKGLKSLTHHYNLPVNARNWGEHINAIKRHLASVTNKEEKEQLQRVIERIDSLRIVERNPTLHVEKDYSEDQAEFLFDGVKNLMDAICPLLPSGAP
jgi:HEPN domain-containing protein